jgi:hypothetical protein
MLILIVIKMITISIKKIEGYIRLLSEQLY